MPRNLDHRVELAVPIEAPALREELLDVLERAFADNQSSWDLDADGHWHRNSVDSDPGRAGSESKPRSLQLELAELYAARARNERHSAEREVGALGAGRP
jgi:polyphosphate kinase